MNIKLWIGLFFLIRLFGITNAPLEIAHNWRQSLTNMITRNFIENGLDLFHPMIDMAGQKTGIIGSEFPFYNWLVYLMSSVFGYEHWHGRLINLIVSSIGIYFFYKLVKGIINEKIAFTSTLLLLLSIWFSFSRKIMPDTFSVSLMIIALYYAYSYLKNGKALAVLLFFGFATLGMLCKIPALSLFAGLGAILFINQIDLRRKIVVIAVGTVAFAITCIWYFYWVPHLVDTYRFMLFFPKTLGEGLTEISTRIPLLLGRFYFDALHSYIAFAFFLIGLYFLFKSDRKHLKIGLLLITIIFGFFIIKTGRVFPNHSYYIVPFVPIMAIVAAFALEKLPNKWHYVVLGIIAIESVANQQNDFFVKDSETYKLSLDGITAKHIPKDDLVIINGGLSPQDIYFSHRKGWTLDHEVCMDAKFIDSLVINYNAKYLILNKNGHHSTAQSRALIYDDKNYAIYKLEKRD